MKFASIALAALVAVAAAAVGPVALQAATLEVMDCQSEYKWNNRNPDCVAALQGVVAPVSMTDSVLRSPDFAGYLTQFALSNGSKFVGPTLKNPLAFSMGYALWSSAQSLAEHEGSFLLPLAGMYGDRLSDYDYHFQPAPANAFAAVEAAFTTSPLFPDDNVFFVTAIDDASGISSFLAAAAADYAAHKLPDMPLPATDSFDADLLLAKFETWAPVFKAAVTAVSGVIVNGEVPALIESIDTCPNRDAAAQHIDATYQQLLASMTAVLDPLLTGPAAAFSDAASAIVESLYDAQPSCCHP
jgi:hypothetical protein